MKDPTEAKVAWMLWKLLTDLSNLLWRRYQQHFLDWILKEPYPTQKTTEKSITGQVDDQMPF